MPYTVGVRITLAVAIVALIVIPRESAWAQPNPYRMTENWGTFPAGRTMGVVSALDVDRDGNIWVLERCGANTCAGSNLAPIFKFDPSGKLLKSFGEGMLVWPHGLHVDKDGNVWVTDGRESGGKGHQVFKFSPEGKVLLTLGKAGVAGDGPDTFNAPSAVVIAPNGDIFVADGHGDDANNRIVKFSKEGRFIKTWGKKGSAPGEFYRFHALALDSEGRLLVADRGNGRIQIFDQDGNFLEEWKQFGGPGAIFIDGKDTIYVTDAQSGATKRDPGYKHGIRIGSAEDGVVTAFIPASEPERKPTGVTTTDTDALAADSVGNIYVGDSIRHQPSNSDLMPTDAGNLRKYVKH